jgi:hypothetical protein
MAKNERIDRVRGMVAADKFQEQRGSILLE